MTNTSQFQEPKIRSLPVWNDSLKRNIELSTSITELNDLYIQSKTSNSYIDLQKNPIKPIGTPPCNTTKNGYTELQIPTTETEFAENSLSDQIQFGSISNIFKADPEIFKRPIQMPPKQYTPTAVPMPTKKDEPHVHQLAQVNSGKLNAQQKPTYSESIGIGIGIGIGMNNIPVWLKSLRLHKYTWIFTNLSYEQMLNITEQYLEDLKITKGARDKLLICIGKLKDRFNLLCQIEGDLHILNSGDSLSIILDELIKMVVTPMKPILPDRKDDVGLQLLKVINLGKFFARNFKYFFLNMPKLKTIFDFKNLDLENVWVQFADKKFTCYSPFTRIKHFLKSTFLCDCSFFKEYLKGHHFSLFLNTYLKIELRQN